MADLTTAGGIAAVFTGSSTNTGSTLALAQLDTYLPSAVTSSRTTSTTCLVSWTPAGGAPAGMTYDVLDGSNAVLLSAASGTSGSVTVPTTQTSLSVRTSAGTWTSTGSVASLPACPGIPGAPTGVSATAGDASVAVSWSAPASNGGSAITSYTATAVPSDGTLSTLTCSAAVSPCTVSGLTNGITYTVTVSATNTNGTGPASSSATAIPYPSSVMSSGGLRLWLDGADPTTLFASSGCSGSAATTAVGCWKDKSTGALGFVQATGANQPSLTTVSSRQVPLFDGTADYLQSVGVGNLPTGTNPVSLFTASRLATAPANEVEVFAYGGTAHGSVLQLNVWNSGQSAFFCSWFVGCSQTPGTPVVSNTTMLLTGISNSSSLALWFNGSSAGTANFSSNLGVTAAGVGINPAAGTAYWPGSVEEVVAVSGSLSAANRRIVEEYLARKWSVIVTPQAPDTASATAGTSTATVTFTAPAWNGGASVSSYTVTPSGAGSCTVSGTTANCTGLTHGASYTFTVTATNSAGTGPSITTNSVTP